ncbi:MAG TPA: UDP-N-acetylmuramoyl-L-alanyl-D-glutamate--2,6-diaminopimelate ligase [Actinomycetes bacterium]|nr:UDP-N-acetylmuramoyl-L-alanyl-D-glutamate--2,6-diaminopimelate ligase [Actinomycetes bacterium]
MDAQQRTPRPTPRAVSLADVCARLGFDPGTAANTSVTGVSLDSRDVRPGDLFIGLPGERVHGARFANQASADGAVAVLTDSEGRDFVATSTPLIVVHSPRGRVGEIAAEVYGRPADQLLTIGVTGTNGKTTTTYLLESGLRSAGHRTGVVGTVGTIIDGAAFETSKTTPEATELHALLAVMLERGVTAVAMEVSSHALAMGRVDGCRFDVAGFTQLSTDHLDFHRSEEAYFDAKLALFQPGHSRQSVVTIDDEGGRRIADGAGVPVITVGFSDAADWTIEDVRERLNGGYRFELSGPDRSTRSCEVSLMGRFNVSNAALAQLLLETAGVDASTAAKGIALCPGVPGRMERVGPREVALVVDYAHTTDALGRAIDAVRPSGDGRVIVVFGCGGDRDSTKRAPMGAVAARRADIVVITDDNPRSEDPATIRQAVLSGAQEVEDVGRAEVVVIGDRRAAIEAAVRRARRGDVVLVAGKGHETGQEVDGVVTPFDDRVELAAAWERVQPHVEPS